MTKKRMVSRAEQFQTEVTAKNYIYFFTSNPNAILFPLVLGVSQEVHSQQTLANVMSHRKLIWMKMLTSFPTLQHGSYQTWVFLEYQVLEWLCREGWLTEGWLSSRLASSPSHDSQGSCLPESFVTHISHDSMVLWERQNYLGMVPPSLADLGLEGDTCVQSHRWQHSLLTVLIEVACLIWKGATAVQGPPAVTWLAINMNLSSHRAVNSLKSQGSEEPGKNVSGQTISILPLKIFITVWWLGDSCPISGEQVPLFFAEDDYRCCPTGPRVRRLKTSLQCQCPWKSLVPTCYQWCESPSYMCLPTGIQRWFDSTSQTPVLRFCLSTKGV